tara:strand:- start:1616 stop:2059 length:444 start_codon:yes stop_codon:yes gene_type:complete
MPFYASGDSTPIERPRKPWSKLIHTADKISPMQNAIATFFVAKSIAPRRECMWTLGDGTTNATTINMHAESMGAALCDIFLPACDMRRPPSASARDDILLPSYENADMRRWCSCDSEGWFVTLRMSISSVTHGQANPIAVRGTLDAT